LGGSSRFSYFLTSTPLRCTPIITVDLLQAMNCWDKEILTSSLC
jgi:hypothetical protein